jgi:hypothetical protein
MLHTRHLCSFGSFLCIRSISHQCCHVSSNCFEASSTFKQWRMEHQINCNSFKNLGKTQNIFTLYALKHEILSYKCQLIFKKYYSISACSKVGNKKSFSKKYVNVHWQNWNVNPHPTPKGETIFVMLNNWFKIKETKIHFFKSEKQLELIFMQTFVYFINISCII